MNAARSPTSATDSSNPKVGELYTKTRDIWHHSVDKKHYAFPVKFEVKFVISFTRKSMVGKK
jgi:hypothetical protein